MYMIIKIPKRLIILLTLIFLFDLSVFVLGTKGNYFTFLNTVLTIVSLILLIKIYWIIVEV